MSDFDARKVTAARHGGKRAREVFSAALPQQRPGDPLGFVEIDHSPMDVIVVDEQSRLPLGRPWLSLAVDVPTRMVAGFHLSFDDPSVLVVALVLTHAALPKEGWLAERQISLPWPVSGIPDWIETDNGEEFHSKAFERGAAEYGIRLTYRPRGAPQAGGHIERLIGTFMHRIHLIPGTTFSNVADKGGYDSEGRAVMTLKELEHWLALEILGVYHKSVHSAFHQPPEQAWQQRISRRQTPVRHPPGCTSFSLGFSSRGGTADPPGWYPDVQPALLGQRTEPSRRPFPAAFRREIRPARSVSGLLARRKGRFTGPFPIAILARRPSRYGSIGTRCKSCTRMA